MACVYFVHFQPKSLHACPPAVPPPSSAMLKAIRESSMKGKNAEEAAAKTKTRPLNNALTLKKEAQVNYPNLPNNVHSSYMTPLYGVNYPQRAVENDINSNWAQASSISKITNIGAALEQHGEPGMGSLKDRVVALKEALRVATERQAKAKEGIPAARKRFQEAKILLSKMERKRFIAEDKVEKLEEKIHHQEGRLQNKYRTMSENWHVNHQFKQKKSEELRNWKNIEYEITELKAAREASMERVREASRRLVIVQSAIQNADDRCRELNARSRTLQDMLEMYNKRIRDLRSKSLEKSVVTKKKATRKDMLQDYISERKERFKRAERRLLPLKIYINQLHDSIEDGHKELRHAQLLLANCKQRIRKRSYEYYPYTN